MLHLCDLRSHLTAVLTDIELLRLLQTDLNTWDILETDIF